MRFIYSFLTLILLLSCSDSNEYEPEISHAKTQISFNVTTEALSDSTQSRGITINHPSNIYPLLLATRKPFPNLLRISSGEC